MPDIKDSKSLNDLITKLNDDKDKNDKLINNLNDNNKNKINEDDYINEMGEFAKYDKNLSNGAFIKNKLKENGKLKNSDNNIFDIIKIVDEEYNNLVNGKYCNKCGKELTNCQCDDINYIFKETEESKSNENENNNDNKKEEDDDDNLDFGIGDDNFSKHKKINYFEYDSNKSKGLLITNKPKLSNFISLPKENLVIYNKKQLNDMNRKKINNNNSIYINNNYNNLNSSSSLSGNRFNNRDYNITSNINTSNNFNNDNNTLTSQNNNNSYKGKYYNKGYYFNKYKDN